MEISGGARLYAVSSVEGATHEHATLIQVPDLSGHPPVVMEMIAPQLQEAVRIMLFAPPSHVSKTTICITIGNTIGNTKWKTVARPIIGGGKFYNKFNYLARRPMVPLAGIEPATSGSTIRRSNHLSYNGTFA